LKLD